MFRACLLNKEQNNLTIDRGIKVNGDTQSIRKSKTTPRGNTKWSRVIQNGQRSHQKAESYQKSQRLLKIMSVTEISKVTRDAKTH